MVWCGMVGVAWCDVLWCGRKRCGKRQVVNRDPSGEEEKRDKNQTCCPIVPNSAFS